MKKAILFARVSTESQEVDSQREVLLEYVRKEGYADDEIVVIDGVGSAIKVNDLYKTLITRLKTSLVEYPTIRAVYVNDLDRLGRNDEILIGLKNFFVEQHVNLIIKNLGIRLLNDDGSLNTGAELAFSLMATLAKQEMLVKKERFRRGKQRNKDIGRFNGGVIQYGFSVNENGYFIVDEKEADVIRLVYELYIDGYSTYTLRDELKARGIKTRNNKYFRQTYISKILNTTQYVEAGIITQEMYDKADKIKTDNISKTTPHNRQTKRDYLLNRLITCPCCGMHFVAKASCYLCVGYRVVGCTNNVALDINTVDKIAWYVAKEEEKLIRLNTDHSKSLANAQERLSVALSKVDVCKSSLEKIGSNRERIIELYADGEISKTKKEEMLGKNAAKADMLNTEIATLEREVELCNKLIENITHPNLDFFYKISKGVEMESDKKKEIIRRHIADVRFSSWHNNPKKNIEIIIKTVTGEEKTFKYFPYRNEHGYKIEYRTKNGYKSMQSL